MPASTPELTVAERAARAASEVLKRYWREGVASRAKDVNNLVSDADIEAERAIVETIHAAYPEHAVLGEEEASGDIRAEHLWVVDPLDGTNNFLHKIPHFAVSIAYYRNGLPECGVVVDPLADRWYTAARGQGAWCDGERARVSEFGRLDEVIVGVGFYYDRGAMMEATLRAVGDLHRAGIHGIRRFGTAAIDLCLVGLGQFGAFFEYELSPWDFAAGRLFVEEAGGQISDTRGEALGLVRSSVLASNRALHGPMLEITRRHHPGEPGQ